MSGGGVFSIFCVGRKPLALKHLFSSLGTISDKAQRNHMHGTCCIDPTAGGQHQGFSRSTVERKDPQAGGWEACAWSQLGPSRKSLFSDLQLYLPYTEGKSESMALEAFFRSLVHSGHRKGAQKRGAAGAPQTWIRSGDSLVWEVVFLVYPLTPHTSPSPPSLCLPEGL